MKTAHVNPIGREATVWRLEHRAHVRRQEAHPEGGRAERILREIDTSVVNPHELPSLKFDAREDVGEALDKVERIFAVGIVRDGLGVKRGVVVRSGWAEKQVAKRSIAFGRPRGTGATGVGEQFAHFCGDFAPLSRRALARNLARALKRE